VSRDGGKDHGFSGPAFPSLREPWGRSTRALLGKFAAEGEALFPDKAVGVHYLGA